MSGRDHEQYGDPIPGRELLAAMNATPAERMAVQRAVRATLAWEQWALAQPRNVGGARVPYAGQTGEQVLDAACADWRRRVQLMSATIALAAERRGTTLTAQRLRHERARGVGRTGAHRRKDAA